MKPLLVCALAALMLAGCEGGQEQTLCYPVYFRTMEGEAALAAEHRTLPSGMDPAEGLLNCLLEGPEEEGLLRTIPPAVTIRSFSLKGGVLEVDFSGRYASLSGIDLTLADYSVVRTLSQLEEVETVVITVEGQPLLYRDHQQLTVADAWFAGEEGAVE